MRTLSISSQSGSLQNNGWFIPNALQHIRAFRLRPLFDAQVISAGVAQGPGSTLFQWHGAPVLPLPGPFKADIYFHNQDRKTIFITDDRVYDFGREIKNVDLTVLGFGSNIKDTLLGFSTAATQIPQIFNAGCQSVVAADIFERESEAELFPVKKSITTVPLFYGTKGVTAGVPNAAGVYLAGEIAQAPGVVSSARADKLPSPIWNGDFFGMNEECATRAGPNIFTANAGAFYIFRETNSWRVCLQAVAPVDIQIWSGKEQAPYNGGNWGAWMWNETISAANWIADDGSGQASPAQLVIERDSTYADEWIQIVATTGDSGLSVTFSGVQITQASMTVEV